MTTCPFCNLPINDESPGGSCRKCKEAFHLACMSGKTRENMLCPMCAKPPSVDKDTSIAGFAAGHGGLSSTVLPGMNSSSRMEKEIEDLKAMVAALQRRPELAGNNQSQSSLPSVADETGSHVSASMNRSQQAIMDSIRINPLSKPELECRRNCGPLPMFNGQPSQWFVFMASYRDSAAKCGYSAVENLKRISNALLSPARDTVVHLLQRPHKLEKVLAILENNFGRPEIMLSYAEDLARQMDSLSDNLANLPTFYADVMTVQDALELADESSSYASLVEGMVRNKLSLQHGREWLVFKAKKATTITLFSEFVECLLEQVQQLRTYEFVQQKETIPETHPVLLQTNVAPPTSPRGCVLGCETRHAMSNCPKFLSMSVRDRWQFVRRSYRCVSCLERHHGKKCNCSRRKCDTPDCPHFHHQLLHEEQRPTYAQPVAGPSREFLGVSRQQAAKTVFRVAPVTISANGKSRTTYALLDTGSSVSLITTALARRLGLQGKRTTMNLDWTNSASRKVSTERLRIGIRATEVEQVGIETLDSSTSAEFVIEVNTMDDLALPQHSVTRQLLVDEGFDDLPIIPMGRVVPQLLIGLDNARLIVALETRIGHSGQLVASRTALGWVVMGQTQIDKCLTIRTADHEEQEQDDEEVIGLVNDDVQLVQLEKKKTGQVDSVEDRRGDDIVGSGATGEYVSEPGGRQEDEETTDHLVVLYARAVATEESTVSRMLRLTWLTVTNSPFFRWRACKDTLQKKALCTTRDGERSDRYRWSQSRERDSMDNRQRESSESKAEQQQQQQCDVLEGNGKPMYKYPPDCDREDRIAPYKVDNSSSSRVSSASHQERRRTREGERFRSEDVKGDWSLAVRDDGTIIEMDFDRGRPDHPDDDQAPR